MNKPKEQTTTAPCAQHYSSVILPSHVIAKEALRKSPFCKMFGCCEFETVAKAVVQFLATNGNQWDVTVDVRSLGLRDWDIDHGHTDCGDHNFVRDFIEYGKVNERFVAHVTRYSDYQELRDDVIAKLIDWPHVEID